MQKNTIQASEKNDKPNHIPSSPPSDARNCFSVNAGCSSTEVYVKSLTKNRAIVFLGFPAFDVKSFEYVDFAIETTDQELHCGKPFLQIDLLR
jgi:hypothetical protein